MSNNPLIDTIHALIAVGDLDTLISSLPSLVVGDDEISPEVPHITPWDYSSVYLYCFVVKKDLVNAKRYADILISTANTLHGPFEFRPTEVLLNYVLLVGAEVGYLDPQLDEYKKFIEDFGPLEVDSWSTDLLKYYTTLWLNEADALLDPPTYLYFQRLLEASAITLPGYEALHDRVITCLLKLGEVT